MITLLNFQVIFFPSGFNLQLFQFATSYIFWSILISTVIYVVLRTCRFSSPLTKQNFLFQRVYFHSNTREESCESALIIHKILQNKPAFMVNDESFYSKMKSFTLQILHRKKVKSSSLRPLQTIYHSICQCIILKIEMNLFSFPTKKKGFPFPWSRPLQIGLYIHIFGKY